MTPMSDSTFTIARVNAVITFHREPDGTVDKITLNQNGVHPATRVAETPAAKPDLAPYAGRYFSAELETFYDITVEGDALMLRSRRTSPARLQHQAGELFTGGTSIASITFQRDEAGTVVAFRRMRAAPAGWCSRGCPEVQGRVIAGRAAGRCA